MYQLSRKLSPTPTLPISHFSYSKTLQTPPSSHFLITWLKQQLKVNIYIYVYIIQYTCNKMQSTTSYHCVYPFANLPLFWALEGLLVLWGFGMSAWDENSNSRKSMLPFRRAAITLKRKKSSMIFKYGIL